MIEAPSDSGAATSGLSASARAKGTRTRKAHGLFNRYIRALKGPKAERVRARIAGIDAMLTRGTRLKASPVWADGERVGTVERELPLLPSETALWMARRKRLRASLDELAPADLRADFLQMLPEYARQHELDRQILLAVGAPARDLDAAGIHD